MDQRGIDRKWDRGAALAFLSGLVITIVGAVVVMVVCPQPPWTGVHAFTTSFHPLQSLIFVPSLALPLGCVAVLVGLHSGASAGERRWGLLALALGIVGAAIVCINYLIQAAFVPALVRQGSEAVGILASANPGSLFWGLELFGYGIIGLGLWAAAPLFRRPGLDRAIGWVLTINGAGSFLAAAALAVDSSWVLGVPGLGLVLAWNLLMLALAVMLVRRSRSGGAPPLADGSPGS